VLIIALCASIPGAAQVLLQGQIQNESAEPLAYATVQVMASDSTMEDVVLTDSTGTFSLVRKPSFSYLKVSYVSFFDQTVPLVDDQSNYVIEMESDAANLDEIVVSAAKVQMESKSNGLKYNVGGTVLESLGNSYDIFERLPGMNPTPTGELNFRGRGALTVYVNQKRLRLTGEQLNQYLRSIPSSDIDNIFIENNFSARDEAAGVGSVIRITLKRDSSLGFKGNASLNGRIIDRYRVIASTSLEYSPTKALRAYGRYSFTKGESIADRTSRRTVQPSPGFAGSVISQIGEQNMLFDVHSAAVGIDLQPSKKSFFNIEAGYIFDDASVNLTNTTREVRDNLNENIQFLNAENSTSNNFSADAYYELTLDTLQSKIEITANYFNLDQDDNNLLTYKAVEPTGLEVDPDRAITNTNPITISAIGGDYIKNYASGLSITTGYKFSLAQIDNDQLIYDLLEGGGRELNNTFTNEFTFREEIHAGFIQANKQISGFNVSVGLRGENSNTTGEAIVIDSSFTRNIFALFPSISLYRKFGTIGVSASYSRRIGRPSYSYLNPTLRFINDITFERGNVALLPQFSNNISLNVQTDVGFTGSVYLSSTENFTLPLVLNGFSEDDLITTYTNIGSSLFGGVYLSFNKQVLPKWRLNLSSGIYYSSIKDKRNESNTVTTSAIQGYYMNAYNTINLPKQITATLGINYQGPSDGIWRSESVFSTNLSLAKSFDPFNVQLRVDDIFGTVEYVNIYNYLQTDYISTFNPRARKITLSINVPFGNKEVRRKKQFRNSGIEDERQRVGS